MNSIRVMLVQIRHVLWHDFDASAFALIVEMLVDEQISGDCPRTFDTDGVLLFLCALDQLAKYLPIIGMESKMCM